jgi:hypothetical protein
MINKLQTGINITETEQDPCQQALAKLAANRLRITIDGRLHAARVAQRGESIFGITIHEDSICAFEDGALVKIIPAEEYLVHW